MKGVKHIFFDLDHTLWDYDRNAQETLREIHGSFNLEGYTTEEKFVNTFYKVNERLWHKYNHGHIDRAHIKKYRFVELFEKIGASKLDTESASDYFINNCSNKPHLIAGARMTLDYLHPKYDLHIITNGFNDIQPRKLASSRIDKYFEVIVTSESTSSRKPDAGIFQFALNQANASKEESFMIGDNPKTDIHGARDFGMRTVLLDPSGKKRSMADFSIQNLQELIDIF